LSTAWPIKEYRNAVFDINSQKYTHILDAHLWPVIAKHLGDKPFIFQDDKCTGTQFKVYTRLEINLKSEIHAMTWPAQSPDLIITENI